MAAVVLGVSTASSVDATTYTSAPFTPAQGDLLVAFIDKSADISEGTLSDTQGLGWTHVVHVIGHEGLDHAEMWVANSKAAAVSMTVTAGTTGAAATGCIITVLRVSGMARFGLDAIRQFAQQADQPSGTKPAPTFGSAVQTQNATVGFLADGNNPVNTPVPVGWTERSDIGYNTPATGGQSISRDRGFTGTTVQWPNNINTSFGVIVAELDISVPITPQTGAAQVTGATLAVGAGLIPLVQALLATGQAALPQSLNRITVEGTALAVLTGELHLDITTFITMVGTGEVGITGYQPHIDINHDTEIMPDAGAALLEGQIVIVPYLIIPQTGTVGIIERSPRVEGQGTFQPRHGEAAIEGQPAEVDVNVIFYDLAPLTGTMSLDSLPPILRRTLGPKIVIFKTNYSTKQLFKTSFDDSEMGV